VGEYSLHLGFGLNYAPCGGDVLNIHTYLQRGVVHDDGHVIAYGFSADLLRAYESIYCFWQALKASLFPPGARSCRVQLKSCSNPSTVCSFFTVSMLDVAPAGNLWIHLVCQHGHDKRGQASEGSSEYQTTTI
jgi:hypothetical protein